MNDQMTQILLDWYAKNKRDLPWRRTADPYKIWLSEVIMQQTRINQGLAYYLRFVDKYPDIFQLASAKHNEVYKLWQGLGYYNRADNLMKTAQRIAKEFGGKFPNDYHELKKLPGIGDYTAAAIASLAFKQSYSVVDGNVFRVLSRIYGIQTSINTSQGKKEFTQLATSLLANHPPDLFNQAMMEFGALACTPKAPHCADCPLQNHCYAFVNQAQANFPVKKAKTTVGKRFIYYFVIQTTRENSKAYYLKKRQDRDIWKNLYDFPSVERKEALVDPFDAVPLMSQWGWLENNNYKIGPPSHSFVHLLTHLRITAYFIPVFLGQDTKGISNNSLLLIPQKILNKYPVSQLIALYLKEQGITH